MTLEERIEAAAANGHKITIVNLGKKTFRVTAEIIGAWGHVQFKAVAYGESIDAALDEIQAIIKADAEAISI